MSSQPTLIPEPPQAERPSSRPPDLPGEFMDEYNRIFSDCWKKPLALTKDRRDKIATRLKSFSLPELIAAAENLHKSPHHRGQNDAGVVYGTPEFLCRNDGMVDKWLKNQGQARASPNGFNLRDLNDEKLAEAQRKAERERGDRD